MTLNHLTVPRMLVVRTFFFTSSLWVGSEEAGAASPPWFPRPRACRPLGSWVWGPEGPQCLRRSLWQGGGGRLACLAHTSCCLPVGSHSLTRAPQWWLAWLVVTAAGQAHREVGADFVAQTAAWVESHRGGDSSSWGCMFTLGLLSGSYSGQLFLGHQKLYVDF